MHHIFEHSGVMLSVDYEQGSPPLFRSVRVLGADYKPTGPDLLPLLHSVAFVGPASPLGLAAAQHFLSAIVEELP